MTQRSQPAQDHVNNYPTSDAGPYSSDEWSDMFFSLFSPDDADMGPLIRYLNELEVTDDGADIDVDTGGAMADGHWFKNDASLAFTIPHPAANPRIDRVVVCVNNTAVAMTVSDLGFALDFPDILTDYNLTASIEPYSARLVIVQGTEAAGPVAPGLDQNANHYMIPLYQYQISVAGAITAGADQRDFCLFASTHTEVTEFVQAAGGYNTTDGTTERRYNGGQEMLDNKACDFVCNFIVPHNFGSDMSIKAVVSPFGAAAGNLRATMTATYGQCGESPSNHSDTTGATTVAITATLNCIMELTLTNAAKGDLVSILFSRDGANVLDTVGASVYGMGVQLIYNPDSHK